METQRRRARFLAIVLSATLAFSVVGAGAPVSAANKVVKAKGTKNKWNPVHSYIGKGDKIIWRNRSRRVHDVSAWGKGWSYSKVLRRNQQASRKFGKRGTFKFRCVRHSAIVDNRCQGMCGFVHVR